MITEMIVNEIMSSDTTLEEKKEAIGFLNKTTEIQLTDEEFNEDNDDILNYFFDYLESNNVSFEWERMYKPTKKLSDDLIAMAKTRRMKTFLTKIRLFNELSEKNKNKIMKKIINELEEEFKIDNVKKFYFLNLSISLVLFDPDNVNDYFRGLFIRYARIRKK